MSAWIQDAWFWMNDAKDGWLPVQFISQSGDTVTLKTAEGEHYDLPASSELRPALASSLRPCSNLLELEELHEGAILNALRLRYATDDIYTNISSIVLSVNPYKQLACYGPSHINLYRRGATSGTEELPPHVYALAQNAYTSLVRDRTNQAIIISGESGAGKTEATKLVLQHLAEVGGKEGGKEGEISQQILEANPVLESFGNAKTVRNNNSSRFGKWMEVKFEDHVVSARICGARIDSYLLEKSRVVNQALGERNYHAPYQLCAGASPEEREMLHLPTSGNAAAAFRILRAGQCFQVDGQNDVADYAELKNAMGVLNFPPDEVQSIMKILAAVLHVGNIEFEKDDSAATAGASSSKAVGPASPTSVSEEKMRVANAATSLDYACELLGLDAAVCAKALLTRPLRIGGELFTVFNTDVVCGDNRDSLCKALYECLFLYLIARINMTLSTDGGMSKNAVAQPKLIGVLDIFGFENFTETGNYFEQLCINYANEKLNCHFCDYVFKIEAKIYASEGIDVSAINFVDHSVCLALIEEKRTGIIDMISEELRLPKGSDANLLQRMHDLYAPQPAHLTGTPAEKAAALAAAAAKAPPTGAYYIRPKTRDLVFGVRHYAGEVTYQVAQFMEKSKDALPEALGQCIESSSVPIVAKLLEEKTKATASQSSAATAGAGNGPMSPQRGSMISSPTSPFSGANPNISMTLGSPTGRTPGRPSFGGARDISATMGGSGAFPSPSAARGGGTMGGGGSGGASLGAQFRTQLSDLLATLNACDPSFIRCIKPNASKIPDFFDSMFVLRQLQYLGIKEVISVRQQGFPVRMKYRDFLQRYRIILTDEKQKQQARAAVAADATDDAVKAATSLLLNHSEVNVDVAKDTRLGRTQVFFRNVVQTRLEAARDAKFIGTITKIQAWWRMTRVRRKFARVMACARKLKRALEDATKAPTGEASVAAMVVLDEAINEAAAMTGLPQHIVAHARKTRQRLHEIAQARRALDAAIASKDVPLLRKALEKATEVQLPEDTPELQTARDLLDRLVAYQAALASAMESKSIPALQAVLETAKSLGLDSQAERDCAALLKRLQEEAELEAALEQFLAQRGPLADLQATIVKAEVAGMVASKPKNNVLFRAQALATVLTREQTLLASLQQAIAVRQLAQIEVCLHEILGDQALEAIHQHPSIAEAQDLKTKLHAAAEASERVSQLRAAFAGGNIAYIEASLVSFRALDAIALESLGAEGRTIQEEAETLLVTLRTRAQHVERLRAALEDRTEPALEAALNEAKAAGIKAADVPEYAAAEKLLASMTGAAGALRLAATSDDLDAIEAALADANKFAADSALIQPAQERRAYLLAQREVEGLLANAVQSGDESLLVMALERAHAAGFPTGDKRLDAANSALEAIRARELAEAERRAAEERRAQEEDTAAMAAEAARAEEERLRLEAEEAQLAAQAQAAAAAAQESAGGFSSSSGIVLPTKSHALTSARSTRAFPADTYRAAHFALDKYPGLRSVDDFFGGQNKVTDRAAAKLQMLSWTKEPLGTKSLLKLNTSGSGLSADDLNTEALALFKTIQGFTGDRVYSFPDSLGCEVLGKALQTAALRDEVFVQLAKQLTNPAGGAPTLESTATFSSAESQRKAWQLFAMACETFPPSAQLKPYLYHFLLQYYDLDDGSASDSSAVGYHSRSYVSFCLRTLQQDLPAKVLPPSIVHVTAFRDRVMGSADAKVYFPDGSHVIINIDATMTDAVCVRAIASAIGLNLDKQLGYGIYHITKGQEPSFITDMECLLDYPASKCVDDAFRFLFAKRIWLATLREEFLVTHETMLASNGAGLDDATMQYGDLAPCDKLAAHLQYFQLLHEIFSLEHYDLDRAEYVRIASQHRALMQSHLFAETLGDQQDAYVQYMQTLEPNFIASFTDQELFDWRAEIEDAATEMLRSPPEAYSPLQLLRMFATRPQRGFQAFQVANAEVKVLPPSLWIGITLHGLFLIDHDTKHVLKAFKFAHLAGWAANQVKFSVRILIGRGKTQQLNFACKHGKRIAATLQEFVDHIVAQRALENQGAPAQQASSAAPPAPAPTTAPAPPQPQPLAIPSPEPIEKGPPMAPATAPTHTTPPPPPVPNSSNSSPALSPGNSIRKASRARLVDTSQEIPRVVATAVMASAVSSSNNTPPSASASTDSTPSTPPPVSDSPPPPMAAAPLPPPPPPPSTSGAFPPPPGPPAGVSGAFPPPPPQPATIAASATPDDASNDPPPPPLPGKKLKLPPPVIDGVIQYGASASSSFPPPPAGASGAFPPPPGPPSGPPPVPSASVSGAFPPPPAGASGAFPPPPAGMSGSFPPPPPRASMPSPPPTSFVPASAEAEDDDFPPPPDAAPAPPGPPGPPAPPAPRAPPPPDAVPSFLANVESDSFFPPPPP